MKKFIFLFVGLMLTASLSAQSYYNSPRGNFKVKFPGTPAYQAEDLNEVAEGTKLHTFIFTSETGIVYLVAFADYPADYFSPETNSTFLESSVEGFFGQLSIVPNGRKDVKSGKIKGLEYTGSNETYKTIYRVFIAGNTVFQVTVLAGNEVFDDKLAASFLKSFKIII